MEAKESIIFISGGVRSGKSTFAEKKALQLQKDLGGNLHYIATAKSTDKEMDERINRHRRERGESLWKTWEQPKDLLDIAPLFQQDDIILLDCLTTWLSNELFQTSNGWEKADFRQEVKDRILDAIRQLANQAKMVVIVSNEVVFESLPKDLVYYYSSLLGELHQILVSESTEAYLVEIGIPLLKKA